MNLFKDIPAGENLPEEINVVVEIPKNSKNKYEYDEEKGYFKLDRALYSSVFFPFEYGFVPQTHSADGDPLDVVLLSTNPSLQGCLVEAQPIGVLLMADEAGEDNKVIAVPKEKIDPRFSQIKDIEDLPQHLKKEIQSFFEDYKKLEPNKFVKIKEWESREKALEIIKKAAADYNGS